MQTISAQQFLGGKPAKVIPKVVPPPNTQTGNPETDNFFSRVGSDFASRGQDVINAVTTKQNPLSAGLQTAGAVAGGVGDIIGEALNPLIQGAANKISNIPAVQRLAQQEPVTSSLDTISNKLEQYRQWALQHPEASKNLESGFNIAGLLLGEKPVSKVTSGIADVGTNALAKAENAIPEVSLKTPKIQDAVLGQTLKDWQRVGEDYQKTGGIIERATSRGKDIPEFLTEQRISPSGLIKNNRFETSDTADMLSTKSVQPFEKVLNQQLEVAEQETPPVDINTIEQRALKNVDYIPKLTPLDRERVVEDINSEFGALRRKYGNAIKLTDLNKEKSNYWSNTRFDSTRPFRGDTNYQVGRAMKDSIERATPDANIHELNSLIGDFYESSKFLRALDGKTPKATMATKVIRGASKAAGAIIGEKAFGLGGGIGGYFAGRTLEYVFENATNNLKATILDSIKKENPAAYEKAIKYLGEKEAERLQTKLLPSGNESPFITPAPTTYEPPAQQINRQKIPNDLQLPPPSGSPTGTPINLPTSARETNLGLNEVKNTKFPNLNDQSGFIQAYRNTGNLTTKILKDLEGKTTVSRQYILDATNRGELKQAERDITRSVLDTMKGDTINVKEFADKVKAELLPLKRVSSIIEQKGKLPRGSVKYESIALPDELRGNIKNYNENIYESPIKTSAGSTHFNGQSQNYFGHTRIEDMADNKTRRVIEIQSDLYQKGNLDIEKARAGSITTDAEIPKYLPKELGDEFNSILKARAEAKAKGLPFPTGSTQRLGELHDIAVENKGSTNRGISKLSQYNDPTAHFRMIREEIKKAAQDGKTKLQFPTGETAMKIEGLGETHDFYDVKRMDETRRNGMANDMQRQNEAYNFAKLKPDELKVGQEVSQGSGNKMIITDVLGDGKFKAVPKDKLFKDFKTQFPKISEEEITNFMQNCL